MYVETRVLYPYSDVALITKESRFSTIVIVAKIMGRVIIFDALSSITGKTIITYVSRELDKTKLEKKFYQMIGKMVTKDVASKYFLTDYENHPIPHLSNGEGAEELTPIEIDELEKQVEVVRFNATVEEAIHQLVK